MIIDLLSFTPLNYKAPLRNPTISCLLLFVLLLCDRSYLASQIFFSPLPRLALRCISPRPGGTVPRVHRCVHKRISRSKRPRAAAEKCLALRASISVRGPICKLNGTEGFPEPIDLPSLLSPQLGTPLACGRKLPPQPLLHSRARSPGQPAVGATVPMCMRAPPNFPSTVAPR